MMQGTPALLKLPQLAALSRAMDAGCHSTRKASLVQACSCAHDLQAHLTSVTGKQSA